MHTTFRVYGSAIGRTALGCRTVGRGFKSVARMKGGVLPNYRPAYAFNTNSEYESSVSAPSTTESEYYEQWNDPRDIHFVNEAPGEREFNLRNDLINIEQRRRRGVRNAEEDRLHQENVKRMNRMIAVDDAKKLKNEIEKTIIPEIKVGETIEEIQARNEAAAKRERDAMVAREDDANAYEAEAVVDLQEETDANKKIMMNRIKSQNERYGTAFEKVMLKDYQNELKKMVQTTEHQQMENFVPFDKGDSNALYDIVNNVCVCELKMFDSDDYRINVKTQSDIINKLHEERDEIKKQYQEAKANGDVEDMKDYKVQYDDKTKEINNPKNYFKIQVTKYTGIDNYYNKITPTYIQDKTTGKLLLRDVKKNGTSILPVRNVGLKIVVWTPSGLYYYNIFDDPDSFEFIPTSKSSDGHSIGYIRPKFKKDTSAYKGSDKNVENYLIPINKLKFFKL
jgi:hypothetical protein